MALIDVDPLLVLLVALGVPLLLMPVAVFVLSVVALALASNPPARAAQNLRSAWKMLGVALLPVPILALIEFAAASTCDSDRFVEPGLDAACFAAVVTIALATPVLLFRRFRRTVPTRTIGTLITIVATCVCTWMVALDVLTRVARGIHDL
jgi:Na+/proline symporter